MMPRQVSEVESNSYKEYMVELLTFELSMEHDKAERRTEELQGSHEQTPARETQSGNPDQYVEKDSQAKVTEEGNYILSIIVQKETSNSISTELWTDQTLLLFDA